MKGSGALSVRTEAHEALTRLNGGALVHNAEEKERLRRYADDAQRYMDDGLNLYLPVNCLSSRTNQRETKQFVWTPSFTYTS